MTETTVNTAPTTPDASGSRLPAPGTFSLDPAHTYSRGSGTVRGGGNNEAMDSPRHGHGRLCHRRGGSGRRAGGRLAAITGWARHTRRMSSGKTAT